MRPLLALTLLLPALALGGEPSPPAAFPHLGLSAAVGVPDGVVVSGVYRPLDFLRLSAGASWNYFGFGLQAGAGVAPFHLPIDPTLNVEVGHYFGADMSWVADQNAGVPTQLRPLLADVGYDYANAQLGAEFGSSRRFVLFVRAGLSFFWATARGSTTTTTTDGTGQTVTVRISDPEFRATLPSAKVGLLYYF
jgi:hypothetical protein